MANIVLSLFDHSGGMVKLWANAGWHCICIDIKHSPEIKIEEVGAGIIEYLPLDLINDPLVYETLYETLKGNNCFIFGFPVCTDLANSGAQHWPAKRAIDPDFQERAARPAFMIERLAKRLKAPYMIENPRGALSKLFRKENYVFDPCDYGGYLPHNDVNPYFPDIIPPRDAYTKTTCIWSSVDFVMPEKLRVPPQSAYYQRHNGELLKVSPIVAKTGGSSARTKEIRSVICRGFAKAVFYANGILK